MGDVSPAALIRDVLLQSTIAVGSKTLRGEAILADAARRGREASYYLQYTPEHLAAYTKDKVKAVHNDDVATLRALRRSGHEMQASTASARACSTRRVAGASPTRRRSSWTRRGCPPASATTWGGRPCTMSAGRRRPRTTPS